MTVRPTDDVEHLKSFHCLQVTVEFAQNLVSTDRKGVYAKLVLFNSDNSAEFNLRSDVILDNGPNPTFDSRMLLPYSAQRRLQFAVWGVSPTSVDYEVGQYTLDLSPFSDRKKSLAAKMKLKDRDMKEVGHLNVRVKMSSQIVTQPTVTKYISKKVDSTDNTPAVSNGDANYETIISDEFRNNMRSLYVLLLDGERFPDIERVSKLDPFVRIVLGKDVLKSGVKKNAGTSAVFDDLFSMPYSGERYFGLELWDQETLHSDRQLASQRVDLQPILSGPHFNQIHDVRVALTDKKGGDAGSVRLRFGLSSDRLLSSSVESDILLGDFPIEGPSEWGQSEHHTIVNTSPNGHTSMQPQHNNGMKTVERQLSGASDDVPVEPTSPRETDSDSDDLNSDDEIWNEEMYETTQLKKDAIRYTTLRCHLYQAQGLPNDAKTGTIDPYVKVRLGKRSVSTNVIRHGGSNVKFDAICDFPHHGERFIIFELFDRQHDRPLGRRAVDMSIFYSHRGNIFEGSIRLFPFPSTPTPPKSQRNGVLYFRLEKKTIAVNEPTLHQNDQ